MGEARKSIETFYATAERCAEDGKFDAEFENTYASGRARHEGRRSCATVAAWGRAAAERSPFASSLRGPGPPFGWPWCLCGERRQSEMRRPDTAGRSPCSPPPFRFCAVLQSLIEVEYLLLAEE